MKPVFILSSLCFLLFLTNTLSAQTVPADPWCKTVKSLIESANKDPRGLAGKQTDSSEYQVTYVCKLPVTGADSVRIQFYPDGGRVSRIVAYYGERAAKKQYEKTYASLVQNLKKCFVSTQVMDYAYELGYGKAVFHLNKNPKYTHTRVCVATQSNAVIDRFPGVMLVVEY